MWKFQPSLNVFPFDQWPWKVASLQTLVLPTGFKGVIVWFCVVISRHNIPHHTITVFSPFFTLCSGFSQTDMQSWEEQSQGAIYTVEYACRWDTWQKCSCVEFLIENTNSLAQTSMLFCSAVKSMTNSSMYFKNIDGLLRQAIALKEQISSSQGRR